MASREKIREEIAKYLYECDDGCFPNAVIIKWEDAKVADKQEYYDRADHILIKEHSQEVVIKKYQPVTPSDLWFIEPLIATESLVEG